MEKSKDYELARANAIEQALGNTGICLFMYYPQTKTITVPQKACETYQCRQIYENMPQSFADDYVCDEDYSAFCEFYYKIDRGEKTADLVFHDKRFFYSTHVTLTTVSWTKEGKPDEVIGIIENVSEAYQREKEVNQLKKKLAVRNTENEIDKAKKTAASSIGSQYFAVYHIWLEKHTYVCFREQLTELLSIIGKTGDYEPAWEAYITGYIEEHDQQSVREFVDITTLAERIGHKSSITITYKRKEVGWTRGQFIVGKRDTNGLPLTVIYTVSDINEEMETKLQKKAAEEEALRDPLTKLWNRKAFEIFKEDKDYKNNQSGLLLLDIDRFKGINDQFGHEVGDQVIKAVAQVIRENLRQKDLVFRMGGDEFAALLYNCGISVWETICRKIEAIHVDVKQSLSAEMNVTLSAGLCINKDGYCDEMYKLADQAMYNTKAGGRAGCSWIDIKGNILEEWHDHSSFLRKGEVLEKNSTVTWRLDKPKKSELKHRLFGDELFYAFVGLNSSATPEELYQAWERRIEPGYLEVIQNAAKLAIEDGKVEAVFNWNHPAKGKLQLRCCASFEAETDDYYTFIGYMHVITGNHVATIEDIDAKIKNALEKMYFCNFYIKLKDYSFKVYKAQEYMMDMLGNSKNAITAVDSYIQYMVADDSKEKMATFLDLTTIKRRMKNTDVIGANYNDPNIGWSRAKFVVVDRDENGEVKTVSLVVKAIE